MFPFQRKIYKLGNFLPNPQHVSLSSPKPHSPWTKLLLLHFYLLKFLPNETGRGTEGGCGSRT